MFLEIVFEALTFFLTALFFRSVSDINKSKKIMLLFSLVYASVSALSVHYMDLSGLQALQLVKPVLIMSYCVFALQLIFHAKIWKTITYSAIALMLNGLANLLTLAIFKLMHINTNPGVILNDVKLLTLGMFLNYLFFSALLYSWVVFIKSNKIYTVFGNKFSFGLVLVTLLMFILNIGIYIILLRKYDLDLWYFIFALLILVSYSSFMIFALQRFYKYVNIQKELDQQKFYNTSMANAMDNLRRFKHDIGNSLSVVHAMIEMNRFEQSKAYMKEVMSFNSTLNNQSMLLDVRNAAVNGLLSSKIDYAESVNVKINLNISTELQDIVNVSMMELCEVLGILVDNAIEAVSGKEDNAVSISISVSHNSISFVVCNVLAEGSKGLDAIKSGGTSKGEGRGSGLRIVNSIIKKNKCMLLNTHFEPESNSLFQELTLLQD